MDKLKLYAAPLIAIVLLLVWFVLIKPQLDAGAIDGPAEDTKADAKAGPEPGTNE